MSGLPRTVARRCGSIHCRRTERHYCPRGTGTDRCARVAAFPVGLAPRQLAVLIADYEKRPIRSSGGVTLKLNFPPAWRSTLGSDGHCVFLNVDGVSSTTTSFDFAQYALMGDYRAEKEC